MFRCSAAGYSEKIGYDHHEGIGWKQVAFDNDHEDSIILLSDVKTRPEVKMLCKIYGLRN